MRLNALMARMSLNAQFLHVTREKHTSFNAKIRNIVFVVILYVMDMPNVKINLVSFIHYLYVQYRSLTFLFDQMRVLESAVYVLSRGDCPLI